MEIVYRNYWKNVVMKKNIKIYTLRSSKCLATHPNYYEISSKSSELENIMRVGILTPNFSIKDGLKIVSRTKLKNCWSTIGQGLHYAYVTQ